MMGDVEQRETVHEGVVEREKKWVRGSGKVWEGK